MDAETEGLLLTIQRQVQEGQEQVRQLFLSVDNTVKNIDGRMGAVITTMGDVVQALAEVHQRTLVMQRAMAEDMQRRYRPDNGGDNEAAS